MGVSAYKGTWGLLSTNYPSLVLMKLWHEEAKPGYFENWTDIYPKHQQPSEWKILVLVAIVFFLGNNGNGNWCFFLALNISDMGPTQRRYLYFLSSCWNIFLDLFLVMSSVFSDVFLQGCKKIGTAVPAVLRKV